jgi:ERF superfamily
MNGRDTAAALLAPPESLALTPVELLRIAVSQNADIDKLTKLMDLQERWERNEAKKAFVVAMNAFKANPPAITKNKHVHFGQTDYDHATLDHVCDAVTKGLSAHHISHRWAVAQDGGTIKVTCILTHDLGHSEETSLTGAPDTSGNKNSIQAIGSTVTYLQRYTLMSATGLAASNGDDDATSLSNGDIAEQCEWIANAATMEELQKLYKQAYVKFEGNKNAQRAVIAAKDARKKELQ